MIIRYGVGFVDDAHNRQMFSSELRTELFFFKMSVTPAFRESKKYTQDGRFHHARRICEILWPKLDWQYFSETIMQGATSGEPEVIFAAPGSAGKGKVVGAYALIYWMCDPLNTGVLLGSTSLRGLRSRIWSDIRELWNEIPPQVRQQNGWNYVDNPVPSIQLKKGDMRHGLFCVATDSKNEDLLIGFHPKRLLVVGDELTSIQWSFVEALTNLCTAKQEAQFIGIGNPKDIFDSHGKMSEPKNGWNGVDVSAETFRTKRGGICVHLDGYRSPNVTAGRTVYKYLIRQEDIDTIAEQYGENSPQMWRQRRGWWCPEGTVKSVLSSSIITKMRAQEKAEWKGAFTLIAMLDPAFEGGDRCILRFAACGIGNEGGYIIEYRDIITIKIDATEKTEPVHYQIARRVRDECHARGIPPENFAMDTTGEGGGLASIIKETWGTGFLEVEFGGKPSDDKVGVNDARLCSDVYKNKVTELWYSFREAVVFGQVRGLDAETCIEFCNRIYTVKEKTVVESKSDMKARPGGRSPDLADGAVIGLHLARKRNFLGYVSSRAVANINREWQNMIREMQLDNEGMFLGDPIENL